MAECTAARDFFADQGDLTPPYFVYGKENQRRAAEKDPLLGRFDIFQTRPRLRDEYESLAELCAALDADEAALRRTLALLNYRYDPQQNQFIEINYERRNDHV